MMDELQVYLITIFVHIEWLSNQSLKNLKHNHGLGF